MNFTTLWQHLSAPEYVHVLINPLPVYGLAMGVLGLVLALILRTPKVTMAALVLVFVSDFRSDTGSRKRHSRPDADWESDFATLTLEVKLK